MNEERAILKEQFDSSARLFKALAHPLRLKLICGLLSEPKNQTQISRLLGIPQSSLAQHLAVLRSNGIIEGNRSGGAEIIFSVVDCRIKDIFRTVCGSDAILKYDWKENSQPQ